MAPVSIEGRPPRAELANKYLPRAIRTALKKIFSMVPDGVWLFGGSALSGYHAGHRRSDDIDLFALNAAAYKACVLAVKSLVDAGAHIASESSSPIYYHSEMNFEGHQFTVDVVLDEHLSAIGHAVRADDGVFVADLDTILKMKMASLVSRCSEKDLFDLDWIFGEYGMPDIERLVEAGAEVDSGLNPETLLISLKGATLRREACHFLMPNSKITFKEAYRRIEGLRKKLVKEIFDYEKRLGPDEEVTSLKRAYRDRKKKAP